ncbi:MAG: serpin family protein [Clostridia bacterium]
MPKFKAEYSIDYVNILKNMNEKVFDYQNAISVMYPGMIIEAILQKAMIDVDEKGTEAAAATVIITKISGYRSEEPIEFKADKPFTYYILDDSGNIYFAGRYVKAE